MRFAEIRSPTSVVYGFACVVGTLIVLFGHIRSVDELTVNHLYILLSLIVTLGAGHFAKDATPLSALGFGVLFVVGTMVCVALSGGRSASSIEKNTADEQTQQAQFITHKLKIDEANNARKSLSAKMDEARRSLDEARRRMASQCETGKGTKCEGTNAALNAEQTAFDRTNDEYKIADAHYWDLQSKVELLKPRPSNTELRHLSRAISTITRASEDVVLSLLSLFLPYAFALLTEGGAILFFNHGFSAPKTKKPPILIAEKQITLSEIASELKIDPRQARKQLRILNVPKPAQGWSWSRAEADTIKSQLQTHH